MRTTLQKWGNSQGVRIPKVVLDELGIDVGDEMEIVSEAETIVLRSIRSVRGKYQINELVKEMPPDYCPDEEWGEAQGEEAW